MLREVRIHVRLRVESRLFGAPSRDELQRIEATHDVDLSHLL